MLLFEIITGVFAVGAILYCLGVIALMVMGQDQKDIDE